MIKRIAIVGAGVSGLAAAVELNSESSNPLSITLYESRREAGGRTRSHIDIETGDELDNGQHLMMGCYTSTLEYLEKIGSLDLITRHDKLTIPFFSIGGVHSLTLPRFLPTPLHLLIGIFQSDLLAVHEKMAALRLGSDTFFLKLEKKSIGLNCSQLFSLTKQPESLIHKLWEPIILATMNLTPEKASAEVFINIIRTVFLRDRRYSQLLFPNVGLGKLLVEPALEVLREKDVQFIFGQKVSKITVDDGLVRIYQGENTVPEIFDAVIYTTTSYDGIELPVQLGKQPQITYSPIVNAYLWIDKKILKSPINGFLGTTLQWCFPKESGYCAQLLACTVSAGDTLVEKSNEEIAEILWGDIQALIPEAKYATLLRSQIIREKRATIAITPHIQSERPQVRSSLKEFCFAGDVTQNGMPMTIEGAVRNGQIAAKKIIESLYS